MTPFWHPLSTILLADPACFATEGLLRTLLRAEGTLQLIYAGDRMWPALEDGARFEVRPADGRAWGVGSAVVVCPDGIPDLLRVAALDASSAQLEADADPAAGYTVRPESILAVARLPARRARRGRARRRRLLLDLREALLGVPDAVGDPARTVRDKYQSQAPLYTASGAPELEPGLGARIRATMPPSARLLVVGSGTGRECFGLARMGFEVHGIDFAPAMIEQASQEATRLGLSVRFSLGDVREQELEEGSVDGILFSYDVYSFIPGRAERIEVLVRLRSFLAAGGRLFLSARRIRTTYQRWVLSLQWAARLGRPEWGDSHTRWVSGDGRLHRSYVHHFSSRQLLSEIDDAGLRLEQWEAAHGTLLPRLL